MKNLEVIFRIDLDEYSGLGHFFRCFALAEIINSLARIKFSIPNSSESVISILESSNFSYEVLGNMKLFIDKIPNKSLVVLDGYKIGIGMQKKIVEKGHSLILINDFPKGNYKANAVINSDPYVKIKDYENSSFDNYFLGLDYMIARPAFFENRDNYKNKIDKYWLISFGGTSNLPLYFKYITFLDEFNKSNFIICEKISIILNNSTNDYDQLKLFLSSKKLSFTFEIFQALNTQEIIFLMDKVKFAILPGSGILREAILRNIFCITGYFVDNQKPIAKYFNETKIAINILDFNKCNFENFIKSANDLFKFNNDEYKKINDILNLGQLEKLKSIFKIF